MSKRTALFDEHVKLKAKMVPFAGWEMPIQYAKGLGHEHLATRNGTGLFDVSHMGEIIVRGKNGKAFEFVQSITTNDFSKCAQGQAQYSVLPNEKAGCVDDIISHRISDDEIFICVNASNIEKDFEWIQSHASKDVTVTNESDQYSQIAVQGRGAEKILQALTKADLSKIKYYWFTKTEVLGKPAMIARTGYTGEDGFEVYCQWDFAPKIWSACLESGAEPIGLGARDTLRTEMKYALYGHEIEENINPLEAGLSWVVKLDKKDFVGKNALVAAKAAGLKKSSVGLKAKTNAIPRAGYKVEKNGKEIGVVTSGTMSPCLKQGIAIASIDRTENNIGNVVQVVIRDQRVDHELVETPFYKRNY